jgi:hypothetical protein
MPMILRFDLLMELLSSCIFLSQLLSCLTKSSSVFALISILSPSSEIFFPLVLFCWSGFPLFFCLFVWLKGLFIYRISFWVFFLRFSISLFNSSFIFCVITFNSYISPFILFFVSLGVCWSTLWVPLFVPVSSHVLYFWCLEISWVHLVHSS